MVSEQQHDVLRECVEVQHRQSVSHLPTSNVSCLSYFLNALQKAVGYGPANYTQLTEHLYSCCKSRRTLHLTDRLILTYIDSKKHSQGRRRRRSLLETRNSQIRYSSSSHQDRFVTNHLHHDNTEIMRNDEVHGASSHRSEERSRSVSRTNSTTTPSENHHMRHSDPGQQRHQSSASYRFFGSRSTDDGTHTTTTSWVSEDQQQEERRRLESYYSIAYLTRKIKKLVGVHHKNHYGIFNIVPSSELSLYTSATSNSPNVDDDQECPLNHIGLTNLSLDPILHLCDRINSYLETNRDNVAVINIGVKCTAAVVACLLLYLYPGTMNAIDAKRKYQSVIKLGLFVREGSELRMEILPSELKFIDEFAEYLIRRQRSSGGDTKLINDELHHSPIPPQTSYLNDIVLHEPPRLDRTHLSLMCMVSQGNLILHNSLLKDRGLKRVNSSERQVTFNLNCKIETDSWIRIYHRSEIGAPKLLCEFHVHPCFLDPTKQALSIRKQHLDRIKEDSRFSNDFHIALRYSNDHQTQSLTMNEESITTNSTTRLSSTQEDAENLEELPIISNSFDSNASRPQPRSGLSNPTSQDLQTNLSTTSVSSRNSSDTTFVGMLQEEYYQQSRIDIMVRGPHGALPAHICQLPTSRYSSDHMSLNMKDECQICKSCFSSGDVIRTLPCFHYYHIDCIDIWLLRRGVCPVCRTKVEHMMGFDGTMIP